MPQQLDYVQRITLSLTYGWLRVAARDLLDADMAHREALGAINPDIDDPNEVVGTAVVDTLTILTQAMAHLSLPTAIANALTENPTTLSLHTNTHPDPTTVALTTKRFNLTQHDHTPSGEHPPVEEDKLHHALTHYHTLQQNVLKTMTTRRGAWHAYYKALKDFRAMTEHVAGEVGANTPQFARIPWLTTQWVHGVEPGTRLSRIDAGIIRATQVRNNTLTAEDIFTTLTSDTRRTDSQEKDTQ